MILFVDDEVRRMQPFAESLEFEGFTVRFASSITECRQFMAKPTEIDLIILDVMMPDEGLKGADDGLRTGIALLQEIRRCHPVLPIAVLTNSDSAEQDVPLDQYTVFMRKAEILPFELASIVKSLLGR